MKKNLDKLLFRFVTTNKKEYLFIEDEYNSFIMYRFYLDSQNRIHCVTNNPDVKCSLGVFTQYTPMDYIIDYFYEVDCLIHDTVGRTTLVNVINRSLKPHEICKKLVKYLENKSPIIRTFERF